MRTLKIDHFRLFSCNPQKEIYILTHAHTDHSHLPTAFPHKIYCSPETKLLMKTVYPRKVQFIGSLRVSQWIFIEKELFVYIFASEHCVGGIGLYCPQLSLLHFGEGRPKYSTMIELNQIINKIPPLNGPLVTLCDSFFTKTDMPFLKNNQLPLIPTLQQSSDLLFQFILSFQQKRDNDRSSSPKRHCLLICIAHFGVLSVLPRMFGYHFRIWSTKSEVSKGIVKPATLLCQEAFNLMHFQQGDDICVSRAQDVEKSDIFYEEQDRSNVIFTRVFLSSRWWLLQEHPPSLFHVAVDPKTHVTRIFACSHASSELNTGFLGLCKKQHQTV